MNTFDFHRSFFTFRIDTLVKQPLTVTHKPPFSLNNARIPIECRCVVTEKATDQSQSFVLGASCKTERVGVEGDIWLEPNASYCIRTSTTIACIKNRIKMLTRQLDLWVA